VISISDLLTLIVGAIVSFSVGSIGLGLSMSSSLPPHATNKPAAVHREIVLIAVEASGVMAVIVFTLAGTTLGAVTGPIEPAKIHVVAKAFQTALFVLSTNLLDLLELAFDSTDSIELGLLVICDIQYVVKLLLV
jgi:hypothetical protein